MMFFSLYKRIFLFAMKTILSYPNIRKINQIDDTEVICHTAPDILLHLTNTLPMFPPK
jgi:hypothetical protein